MYYNHHQTKEIQQATTEWFFHLIEAKINYEMTRPGYIGPQTFQDYCSRCLFAITAHAPRSTTGGPVFNAQLRLQNLFGDYYANDLRIRCIRSLTATSRTKFLQPMVITGFDIESTRHGNSRNFTSLPHYHGVILFHHDTVDDYFGRTRCKVLRDGGLEIIPPSGLLKSLYLKNLPTEADAKQYLHYSLKYNRAAIDAQHSYCPHQIYPEKSKYYPFWQHLADMERAELADRI
jgi:hypothetical protein